MSAQQAWAFSRAEIPAGMCDNFKVYAALEMDHAVQDVMKGYNVRFINDEWTYIIDGQHLVYWNGSADRYMFAAGAPIDSVTSITATSITLYMENNTRGSVLAATPLEVKNGSAAFGKPLTLDFNYVHSRICVAFVNDSPTETLITNIKLTPSEAIASEADMTYTYDWSGATPTATPLLDVTAYSNAPFTCADVTIPAGTGDAVVSATRYYCIPWGANPTGWTVSLACNGEDKSAAFVNDKVWEAGKSYMYIFTLSDSEPKLVKVISYDDPAFDCNNIVPGDSFSNSDMTD
ncbi:MAG: fimbrillin family protein [Muribaculaceae bacterium]